MGVPAFFRWLSRKYPSVIIECVERKVIKRFCLFGFIKEEKMLDFLARKFSFQTVDETTGRNIYEDATLPNPNDIEFDNLYLDMNGYLSMAHSVLNGVNSHLFIFQYYTSVYPSRR